MEFYAHIAEDGRKQTVEEHSRNVSSLCAAFADSFAAKEQGALIGMAHDIGKNSVEFQSRLNGGSIVDHSTAGAFECASLLLKMWAAECVACHHTGLQNIGTKYDTPDDTTLMGRLKKKAAGVLPAYQVTTPLRAVKDPDNYQEQNGAWLTDSFIIRFLYSCLVDADFLDTESFMSNDSVARAGYQPIEELYNKLTSFISEKFSHPTNELNRIRCGILQSCIDKGTMPRGIYSLTVPTGGGKTISSLAFALNHAVTHHMERVVYVIPYTSIIEQNAQVFRNLLGDENVLEHHSNSDFDALFESDSDLKMRMIRSSENWDMPVVVTTAVQFFDSLYSNRPSKCRKLHNLANSVIIFDEAQMLPTEHLRPCVAAMSKLVEDMHSSVVLCTATQPSLMDLFAQYAPGFKTTELCPDVSGIFESLRRVTFQNAGFIDAPMLVEDMLSHRQCLCIVNTRKSAQEIYDRLPKEGSYHLSTLMYPAHRRRILNEIRNRLANNEECRVVSTSLIEAGVDIDFPAVFREISGLDSILQAAGRCNREGKHAPEDSVVTIFEGISKTPLMLKVNIQAAREALNNGSDPLDPETVRKYFTAYRSLAGNSLDAANVIGLLSSSNMQFESVADRFHLINQEALTVYIPIGEGKGLADIALAGMADKKTFRKLGRFGVNIFDKEYNQLLNRGSITRIDDRSAVLSDMSLYKEDKGLTVYEPSETAIFV